MAERVKVYEEREKKGVAMGVWLIPLLLALVVAVWLFTRNRHEATPAATPVTDATKPDTGAGTQAAPGWTSASISDAIQSRGRVGFGDADVHFATGSAALAGDSQAVLDSAAQALKNHSDWRMQVVGHTDSTGSSTTNNKLAQQRATTVMTYLVGHGVDQSRLSVDSKADSEPAANNATDTGRADNRRVELIKQ